MVHEEHLLAKFAHVVCALYQALFLCLYSALYEISASLNNTTAMSTINIAPSPQYRAVGAADCHEGVNR